MTTVSTPEHELQINPDSIEGSGSDFNFYYDTGGEHQTLYLLFDNIEHELVTARPINDSLVLYHLETPETHHGEGLGKLGVAFFYYMLTESEYNKYAIKFGGGTDSAAFLRQLGFKSTHVHTAQDADFVGESVMVGKFKNTGDRPYDWSLDPLPINTFPTGFFSLD